MKRARRAMQISGRQRPVPPRSAWHADETGSFLLVEAILVAVLVLSALLFLTLTTRPLPDAQQRGIDLSQTSSDALAILQRRTFTDPGGSGQMSLETWVGKVLEGDAAVAAEVTEFLDEAVPAGARYEVRLNNGVESLVLLPLSSGGAPNGAAGAETIIYPNWKAHALQVTSGAGFPGQQVANVASQAAPYSFTTSATVLCIKGPNGSSTGPGATPWVTTWKAEAGRIPDDIPYGVWAGYTDVACTVPSAYGRVTLPNGTATDYPVYGLQMVVWFGA